MTRILHITSVHPRTDGRIFIKECSSLAVKYSVSMAVMDGQGSRFKNQVNIIDLGKFRRSVKRVIIGQPLLLIHLMKYKYHCLHFHDPELMPIAYLLKITTNSKVIFDIHEDYKSQIKSRNYNWIIKFILLKILGIVLKVTTKHFDATIVAQESLKILQFNKNSVTINNYLNAGVHQRYEDTKFENGITLLYTGSISKNRGIFTLIQIAKQTNIKITIAGSINDKEILEEVCSCAKRRKNLEYLGNLSYKDLNQLYCKSRWVGIIPFLDVPQYRLANSTKLYEYIYYGIPVLMPNHGEWRKLNSKLSVGFNLEIDNIDDIISHFNMLSSNEVYDKISKRNKEIGSKYTWDSQEKILFNVYDSVLKRK